MKGMITTLRNRSDIWMNIHRKQGLFGLQRQDSVSFSLRCVIVLAAAVDFYVLNPL